MTIEGRVDAPSSFVLHRFDGNPQAAAIILRAKYKTFIHTLGAEA
jgi:hypothetical protein